MRFFCILTFIFFLSSPLMAEEACRSSHFQEEKILDNLSSNVKAIECSEINKKNICAREKKVDPNLRERLTNGLNLIDESYQKNGGLFLINKTSSYYADLKNQVGEGANLASISSVQLKEPRTHKKMDANYDNYRLFPRHSKVELVSNYHDFLKTSGSDKNFSKFKDDFIDDFIAFGEEKECQRGVKVESVIHYFSVSRELEKEVGLEDCTQSKDLYEKKYYASKEKFTSYFEKKYYGDNGLKKGYSCSQNVQIKPFVKSHQESPSCAGRFEQHFADNEWELNEQGLSKDESYQEFKSCVEDMQRRGFKLTSVTINSSASQLNNTGKAKESFCQKGFLGLSNARAESAKELLNKNFSFPSNLISINAKGSNRNGSSGECPYEIKNGKEVIKPSYAPGGKDRKTLDSAKYVRVTANFEPLRKEVKKDKVCHNAVIVCSHLAYKCGEWEQKDTSWAIKRARERNSVNE